MGPELTIDDLFAEGFNAVFVGVGLTEGVPLPDAERPAEGVEDALSFLRRMKAQPDTRLSGAVAVLGAGNTAMDAAVTAARAGARDVYLVYRRSFAEMPAWAAERDAALEAGVHFLLLTQPLSYETDAAGRLVGLRVAPRCSVGQLRAAPCAHHRQQRGVCAGDARDQPSASARPRHGRWLPGVRLTRNSLIG